jgi:hypothetical protein
MAKFAMYSIRIGEKERRNERKEECYVYIKKLYVNKDGERERSE